MGSFDKGGTGDESDQIELSVVLPVYNEADKLEKNVRSLHEYLVPSGIKFEIVICNDGSIDDSFRIARKISGELPDVQSIGYEVNRGRGYAIKFCAKYLRGFYIIYMDADLPSTIDLRHLDKMVDYLKHDDIVIASRFHPQANIKRKWHRAFIGIVYRMIVRVVFRGFPVTDPDVGFKGFRRNVYAEVIPYTDLNGWSWDLQFLVNAFNFGFTIKEFPFTWVEDYERSSVNIIKDSFLELTGLIYIKISGIYKYRQYKQLSHHE